MAAVAFDHLHRHSDHVGDLTMRVSVLPQADRGIGSQPVPDCLGHHLVSFAAPVEQLQQKFVGNSLRAPWPDYCNR